MIESACTPHSSDRLAKSLDMSWFCGEWLEGINTSESNNKGDLPNLDHQPSERDVPGTLWYSAGHAGMFFQDAETGPLLLEPVIHVNNMFMEHFVRSRSWSCHNISQ